MSPFLRFIWFLPLLLPALAGCSRGNSGRVVVYCAHDREFADDILQEFTRRTGLEVAVRYDTEANKSVGLYQDLVRETVHPRCDVYWNNEILSTIRLADHGLLEAYASPAADPYPAWVKDSGHAWHGFAARARVILVNTHLVPRKDWPRCLKDLTGNVWKDRLAMAKPHFGTTASEAACLFQAWGEAAARAFYRDLHANGIHIVPGNKQVAVGVGSGQFAAGLTDTDDALAEIDGSRPVVITFPHPVILLPNTVAIIRGCPNPAGARKLVDFLLSPEVETMLARCKSRQIPLNPNLTITLEKPLATLQTAGRLPVDFHRAAALWDQVQDFLSKEFAGPGKGR